MPDMNCDALAAEPKGEVRWIRFVLYCVVLCSTCACMLLRSACAT